MHRMRRMVGLCAACVLLTLGIAGSQPANAQSQVDQPYLDVTMAWSEAHQARLADAATRVSLTADEAAAVKPLLDELAQADQERRDEIAQIEHDRLFVDSPEMDVNTRTDQINAEYRRRVERIWAAIGDRIGATKAADLRAYIYGTAVTSQTTLYQSEHMAKIDQAIADWDKAPAERIAMNERHDAMVREQVAANERLRQEAAAAQVAPAVSVTPVAEAPVAGEAPVQNPAVEASAPPPARQRATGVTSGAASRPHRDTQPVNRRRRVPGLG